MKSYINDSINKMIKSQKKIVIKRKKKNFSNLNSTNFPTLSISKINENPSPIISSRPKTLKLYTKTISLSTNKSLKKSKIMKNGNLKRYFLNKNDFIYY